MSVFTNNIYEGNFIQMSNDIFTNGHTSTQMCLVTKTCLNSLYLIKDALYKHEHVINFPLQYSSNNPWSQRDAYLLHDSM